MSLTGYLMGSLLGRTGVTISAIDSRRSQREASRGNIAGPINRLTHIIGAVPMTSARTMVDNVLGALGDDIISRLNIVDHGSTNVLMLGDDRISLSTLSSHERTLGKLFGRFADDGFVHLQHCLIGNDARLLRALAKVIGVPVVAGTGLGYPNWKNAGSLVAAHPDGTITDSFDRWVGFFSASSEKSGSDKKLK